MVSEVEQNAISLQVTVKYTASAGCKIKIEYNLNQINSANKKTIYPDGQKI